MRRVTDLSPETTEICECCGKVAAGRRLGVFESLEDWWVLGSDVLDWANSVHFFIKVLFVLSIASVGLMLYMTSIKPMDNWASLFTLGISSYYPYDATYEEVMNANLTFWGEGLPANTTEQPSNCASLNSTERNSTDQASGASCRHISLSAFPCVVSFISLLVGLLVFYRHKFKMPNRDYLLGSDRPYAALVETLDNLQFRDKIMKVIPIYESSITRSSINQYQELKSQISRIDPISQIDLFSRVWNCITFQRSREELTRELSKIKSTLGFDRSEPTLIHAYVVLCSDIIVARDLELYSDSLWSRLDGRPFGSVIWENIKIIGCWKEFAIELLGSVFVFSCLLIFKIYIQVLRSVSTSIFEDFLIVISVNILLWKVMLIYDWLFAQMTTEARKHRKMCVYILLEVWICVGFPHPIAVVVAKIALEYTLLILGWILKQNARILLRCSISNNHSAIKQLSANETFQGLDMDISRLYCFDGPLFAYGAIWFSRFPAATILAFLGITVHYFLIRLLMKYEYNQPQRTQIFNQTQSISYSFLLCWLFLSQLFWGIESLEPVIMSHLLQPAIGGLLTVILIVCVFYALAIPVVFHMDMLAFKGVETDRRSVLWHPLFSQPGVLEGENVASHLKLIDEEFDEERLRSVEFYNSLRIVCEQAAIAQGQEEKKLELMEKLMLRTPKAIKDAIQEIERQKSRHQ